MKLFYFYLKLKMIIGSKTNFLVILNFINFALLLSFTPILIIHLFIYFYFSIKKLKCHSPKKWI